jgi:hypothetical protein
MAAQLASTARQTVRLTVLAPIAKASAALRDHWTPPLGASRDPLTGAIVLVQAQALSVDPDMTYIPLPRAASEEGTAPQGEVDPAPRATTRNNKVRPPTQQTPSTRTAPSGGRAGSRGALRHTAMQQRLLTRTMSLELACAGAALGRPGRCIRLPVASAMPTRAGTPPGPGAPIISPRAPRRLAHPRPRPPAAELQVPHRRRAQHPHPRRPRPPPPRPALRRRARHRHPHRPV